MSFFKRGLRKGKRIAREEESEIKDIWRRIKTRDFSGNTGLAVKNSVYQLSTQLGAKIGSFIFTVLVARLLMPELFGLYSLVLSTILVFVAFSEFGISTAIIRFTSKELGKKKGKSKAYLVYFGKIRIFLMISTGIVLLLLSDYLANNFYQKPIFLALLAGILYMVFTQITGFLQSFLYSANNFKSVLKKEIVFQISKIILVPLAVVFAIKHSLSTEFNLMLVILFLALSFFIGSVSLFFDAKKVFLKKIKKEKFSKLSGKQKKSTNKFILATAVLALSGTFFGNIDRIMLGIFVKGEFIGYYTAAFNLIGSLAPLIGFSSIVLLPIFSKIKGKKLEKGFKKSLRITFILATGAFIVTLIIAQFVILIIYGREYILSTKVLRFLAPLLFAIPLIGVYSTYYISQNQPGKVARLLVGITILNVILNYVLITSLLPFGELTAVYGAVIATVISQFAYLGGLIIMKKKI